VFSLTHSASLHLPRRLILLTGLLAGIACTALPVASARANLINTSACDSASLTQPFTRWSDNSQYKLVPGGDFESAASGWTLTGARVVPGSEPFAVTGSLGHSALYLPAGSVAQSPFTCVNAAYPTLRFVGHNGSLSVDEARVRTGGPRAHHHARRHHGSRRHRSHKKSGVRSLLSLSSVVVQVVYQNPLGGQLVLPVGVFALNGRWQPSLPMTTLSAIPGALNGGTAQVALRFTSLTGASQIDDVFIDPRMH
jgi:hypothetical protein